MVVLYSLFGRRDLPGVVNDQSYSSLCGELTDPKRSADSYYHGYSSECSCSDPCLQPGDSAEGNPHVLGGRVDS